MAWVRIDDQLFAHPKIRRAWQADPRAVGLHLLALSYCASYLNDGLIDQSFATEMIPNVKHQKRAIEALVNAGLWETVDPGLWEPNGHRWQIHDWLDYNEPASEVIKRRRLREERRQANRGRLDAGR